METYKVTSLQECGLHIDIVAKKGKREIEESLHIKYAKSLKVGDWIRLHTAKTGFLLAYEGKNFLEIPFISYSRKQSYELAKDIIGRFKGMDFVYGNWRKQVAGDKYLKKKGMQSLNLAAEYVQQNISFDRMRFNFAVAKELRRHGFSVTNNPIENLAMCIEGEDPNKSDFWAKFNIGRREIAEFCRNLRRDRVAA